MTHVLLNIDAGELETEPESLYASAHLVHIACGGHAGDAASMERAVRLAMAAGTLVGAHPSYPDREGFGRRSQALSDADLATTLRAQYTSLRDIAARLGGSVVSAKPHGALYHDANGEPRLAHAIVNATRDVLGPTAWLVGPPNGALARAASEGGLRFLREGFADRGVRSDGSLIPRGEPGALIVEPSDAAARATDLAAGKSVDTICVHGDTPHAGEIARTVRTALDRVEAG
jgi:UPF0271 protein